MTHRELLAYKAGELAGRQAERLGVGATETQDGERPYDRDPQPPLSADDEKRVRQVIASELHLAHPYDRALLASLDRERIRAAEQYVLGHRDGVRCGAENVGFGTTECDHVGSWRLVQTGPFDDFEAATPTPDDRDREVERIARALPGEVQPFTTESGLTLDGMLLVGNRESIAATIVENLRLDAGLRASGGTEPHEAEDGMSELL